VSKAPVTVRKEQVYAHPPEHVWVALTDPRAIAEWMMPNDFKPVVGHKFTLKVDPVPIPGALTHAACEVLEVDRPRRLSYSMRDLSLKDPRQREVVQKITFTLEPAGAGTRLTLLHEGLEGLGFWNQWMQRLGWSGVLKNLGKVAENAGADGTFAPGAIPQEKRCYKTRTLTDELVY
jgi:uncharacterized protein YndB with AHSA1/START domain